MKNAFLVKTEIKMARNNKFKLRNEKQLLALCTVPIGLIVLFNYLPMIGLIIAFKDFKFNKGIFGSSWNGFKNFEFLVKSNDFTRIVWNTFSLNFLFILFGMIAAILLAIFLFEISSRRMTKLYQTLLITPHFLSWVIVSSIAYIFLNQNYGVLNEVMGYFGMQRVDWYSNAKPWPVILTIAFIWKHFGMDSVIYYATLMSLDSSLYEAASIDGAGKRHMVRFITIPSLVPIITILTIVKIGSIFRADFGLFYQLTRDVGALYATTDVIDTYIFRVMKNYGNMSLSSAVAFLQSIVGFIMVVGTNFVVKKINPENSLF